VNDLIPMNRHRVSIVVLGLIAVLTLALAAGAAAKPAKPAKKPGSSSSEHVQPPVETSEGSLEQLPGRLGCLAQGKASIKLCGRARALKGPGPGVGSRAIAISPDGRNVYVAASGSDSKALTAASCCGTRSTRSGRRASTAST